MLTTTHIITLLTVGVLISACIAAITEWAANQVPNSKAFRKWAPLIAGTCLGLAFWPLVYSQVVTPVSYNDWHWPALGALFGVVGGMGSRVCHDVAKTLLGRIGESR